MFCKNVEYGFVKHPVKTQQLESLCWGHCSWPQVLFYFDVLYINGCYFSVVFTADMEKLQQENRWLFSSVCVIDISTKIQEDL